MSDWKFSILLGGMLLLNVARLVSIALNHDRLLVEFLGTLFLVVATVSLCAVKRSRVLALLLGCSSIGLSIVGNLMSSHSESNVLLAGRGMSVLFLGFTIMVILRTLLTQPVATRDSIAGAFCGYLLIGLAFAEAYCIVEVLQPNSFRYDAAQVDLQSDPVRRWLTLEYFSFTTMTTLGFGDVIPTSPAARALAIWEAICGQFYLAVLVAGLVNLRVARTQ